MSLIYWSRHLCEWLTFVDICECIVQLIFFAPAWVRFNAISHWWYEKSPITFHCQYTNQSSNVPAPKFHTSLHIMAISHQWRMIVYVHLTHLTHPNFEYGMRCYKLQYNKFLLTTMAHCMAGEKKRHENLVSFPLYRLIWECEWYDGFDSDHLPIVRGYMRVMMLWQATHDGLKNEKKVALPCTGFYQIASMDRVYGIHNKYAYNLADIFDMIKIFIYQSAFCCVDRVWTVGTQSITATPKL